MALLWKMICNLGDPMSLRHPVTIIPMELFCIGANNNSIGIIVSSFRAHNNSVYTNVSFAKDPTTTTSTLQHLHLHWIVKFLSDKDFPSTGAVWRPHRALLRTYSTLLRPHRALLRTYSTLLWPHRALWHRNNAV